MSKQELFDKKLASIKSDVRKIGKRPRIIKYELTGRVQGLKAVYC